MRTPNGRRRIDELEIEIGVNRGFFIIAHAGQIFGDHAARRHVTNASIINTPFVGGA